MLKELIQDGYGIKEDLNCAEAILYGANQVYHLDLNSDSLKMAAAFGGGMAIEKCLWCIDSISYGFREALCSRCCP